MHTETVPDLDLYTPSEHFCDAINHNIVQSEIEGGVYLPHLPQGATVEVETMNHTYTVVSCGDSDALICGHPTFCPEPVRVSINGSTWGGSLLKQGFIGRSMHLEFRHPEYIGPITTSRIVDIRSAASDGEFTFGQ